MKRALACALVALAFTLGPSIPTTAAPAGTPIHVSQPKGQYRDLGFGTCRVRVLFDNYGSAGYAIMGEYGGSVCNANTALQVWVVRNDTGQLTPGPWCANYMRFSNPYPYNCAFSGLTTQATYPNSRVFGLHAWLCYALPSNPAAVNCADFEVNPL